MLRWLFRKVWRKRLEGRKVIKIKGWRTAVLDEYGERITTTFLIKVGKYWW